ncbi:MAG TPA: hypothetical protein RMH85_05965 [Polyangiaceae bacterium LLY-WYZ-15_(1-7)]|nr:hypothetical protein [Myxococcales bacterium]MAT27629.1 hypothetical protein [Sandaracinus sp.]HJL05634.1 hypothetical protein [Polyangiaceae bacterium LLY-WYZ-15_(1-7)]MBJ70045.1 hypothetical protein [Sandaracinus sp.]HJL08022.1 hypothetical protein [Polyangiaceae bacterium LLY-WYZ-15_(1-7)]
MDRRPSSIFGLTKRLVRLQWQKLTPGGRKLTLVALALFGLGAMLSLRCAMGGCPMSRCAQDTGCPYGGQQQAAPLQVEAIEAEEVDALEAGAEAEADQGGCPFSSR